MNEANLRALIGWARPRGNQHWAVLGQVSSELVQVLFETAQASAVTVIVQSEDAAEQGRNALQDSRVTVRVDDYTTLRKVPGTVDATLDLGVLNDSAEPARVVAAMSRITRLYGILLAIEPSTLSRRTLWDWWLDARLNDVASSEQDGVSMVRGTR